ncbi:MAG: tRNA uridine-5-carboxymethylaminomethyl(34) synthesis GTPase MnmE [Treponema sp.]|nr:tRNA uridine-5-carboxymethylaminomethyl(34) synthesis GTPase MnmE [Treponema sp.]
MDNTHYTPEEPIAAIATALAPAALGIVRTSGVGCIELISKLFSRPKALLEAQGNSIVYGWICEDDKKIDEVLISVYRGPKSYTGEDMCDISCHGGVSIVNAIFNLLIKNGFRTAEKGEFTFRSFINGKSDLTKAEAVKEIIDSKTDFSRSRATLRLSGSLYKEIASIKELLINTLAAIEVDIEYPEDEETISDSYDPQDLISACKKLEELSLSWKSEKIYQDGAKIVLAGKTNAGKSSLFNVLLKEDRSIVSDIEGTTRDWIESWINFDGVPVRVFDTAGLRETEDIIEAKGVELTKDLISDADLILYIIDSSKSITEDDFKFLKDYVNHPHIVVLNKCDKDSTNQEKLKTELKNYTENLVCISAKTGFGIGELSTFVKKAIIGNSEVKSLSIGLGSERQKKSVEEAFERVTHALKISEDLSYGLDAVVQDLEDALDSLGEITGEVTPDDILGSIFSNFCVGK